MTLQQRLQLPLSFLFLLIALALHSASIKHFTPSPEKAWTPAGVWQQYVESEGRTFYLGTFSFTQEGDDYQVKILDISPYAYQHDKLSTFGHTFDGQKWSFCSDWQDHGIAVFDLERDEKGRFVGTASVDGVARPHTHVLIRTE